METVTLKMDRRHIALLNDRAKALGRSRAAVVRDLIDEYLANKKRPVAARLDEGILRLPLRAKGHVHAEAHRLWPRLKYCSTSAR